MAKTCFFAAMLLPMVASCGQSADRADRFYAIYQSAMLSGNLPAARESLQRAVSARDDVAKYWTALGGVQLQMGDYSAAFTAYSHANDLDHSDPQALQALADLSVYTQRFDEALRYADQLELLQPGAVGPLLTRGFVALHRNRYPLALSIADQVQALSPTDTNGLILRARALEAMKRPGEAISILRAATPSPGAEDALRMTQLGIYRRRGDIGSVVEMRRQIADAAPGNDDKQTAYIEALFALGANEAAVERSRAVVDRRPRIETLQLIARLWLRYLPPNRAIDEMRRIASTLDMGGQLIAARLFVATGANDDALAILGSHAVLPATPGNVDALAVAAAALYGLGRNREAAGIVDAVIAADPSNILALRTRVDHSLATRAMRRPIEDAVKLSTENSSSPEDRDRLARLYLLAGDRSAAERTYWNALRDLPGNPLIYQALRRSLAVRGDKSSIASLDRDMATQHALQIAKRN